MKHSRLNVLSAVVPSILNPCLRVGFEVLPVSVVELTLY